MLKDIVGKEIEIGDTIAYPRRSGSSLWMETAKVVDILIEESESFYGNRTYYRIKAKKDSGRIVMVYRVDNVVKIGEVYKNGSVERSREE